MCTAENPDAEVDRALLLAAKAGRFDIVAQFGKELEARRLKRATNEVTLRAAARKKRYKPKRRRR